MYKADQDMSKRSETEVELKKINLLTIKQSNLNRKQLKFNESLIDTKLHQARLEQRQRLIEEVIDLALKNLVPIESRKIKFYPI